MRIRSIILAVVAVAALVAVAAGPVAAESFAPPQRQGSIDTQAPAAPQRRRDVRGRPPGFGARDDTIREGYDGPSVVRIQSPGVKTGEYPPDFQLEPVDLDPQLREWLGEKAPKRFEDKVMLSDLVGEKPVILLFGSYT